ncbi:MAG: T9SS type A sorting domain-containing protein [Chitinophagaceae bacterium]|nr:T9SS type A sorting domain-containing protein [Chitinophagaceae bacterium]
MKPFLTLITFICILNLSTKAQFADYYSAGNWGTFLYGVSNGSVDSSLKPVAITINGSDANSLNSNVYTDFLITAEVSGAWSFSWEYNTTDGNGGADPAYVYINGVRTQLTNNSSPNQVGNYAGIVNAGDIIGWGVNALDDCCGSGNLTISSFLAPGVILPVKMTSFTAKPVGKLIQLSWMTATEANSDRYEIERSTDGSKFEKIGTLKAAGNSTQNQQYAFNDFAPINDANYYRLRQVDKDATATYSKIVMVKFSNAAAITAYPNPAKDMININIGAVKMSQKETISLFNIQGKLLETRKVSLQASTNNIQWNVSGLTAGQYYFKIGTNATPVPFMKN